MNDRQYVAWTRPALTAALLLLGAVSLCPAARAQSGLSEDAAAQQVVERFGVEVLRIAEGEADGRPVYVVTVMNPGGDDNGAFRVTRLMVDRATGELVSQFRHVPDGYVLPSGAPRRDTQGADGLAIRRMTNQ